MMAPLCVNTPFQDSKSRLFLPLELGHPITSGNLFGVFCLGSKAVNTSVEASKEFSKAGKLFQIFSQLCHICLRFCC